MFRGFFAILIVGAASVLTAFHGWLLWTRLAAGGAFDPITAVRWAGAALILVALVVLRRLGVSLVWSRQAAVVWLLVALLHVGASPAVPGSVAARGTDSGLLFAIPAASAAVLSLATLLWNVRRRAIGRVPRPGVVSWIIARPLPALAFAGFASCDGPRPPPR